MTLFHVEVVFFESGMKTVKLVFAAPVARILLALKRLDLALGVRGVCSESGICEGYVSEVIEEAVDLIQLTKSLVAARVQE